MLKNVLLMCVLSLGLWSCSDSDKSVVGVTSSSVGADATKVASPAKTLRVALVMKTLTNPFFVEMEKGARQAEKEAGIELLVKTSTQETSIEQQIQIVADMIESKVDAIVIAPGDSLRVVPILKKAQDAGIKIVNIDNQLDVAAMQSNQLLNVPFISVDNEKAAYEAVKLAASSVKQTTQALIFEGIRAAGNAQLRKQGAERAFAENKLIQVVAKESANWKIDEAYDLSNQLFKQYPDVRLVFCANDMMAIGVMKYLQETKRDKVTLIGFDALDQAVAAVQAGKMFATVDQQAAKQGYEGVMTAIRSVKGETVPALVNVEAKVVSQAALKTP